jgi:hypothetical protein
MWLWMVPGIKEDLYLYLAVSKSTVSSHIIIVLYNQVSHQFTFTSY